MKSIGTEKHDYSVRGDLEAGRLVRRYDSEERLSAGLWMMMGKGTEIEIVDRREFRQIIRLGRG